MREVQPVAGEWFRYYVRSTSRPWMIHLVDLDMYEGNGACGCERFEFDHAPALRQGKRDERFEGIYQCNHIKKAVTYFQRYALAELARRLQEKK